MKVCVVGSGGREHALAHVLARTAEVFVAPGNTGVPFRLLNLSMKCQQDRMTSF